MSSINPGITIERLRGRENYDDWKIAVRALLVYEDLWDNVVDVKQENVVVDPTKDKKASSKLTLLIEPTCYVHIREVKTARGIWNKLKGAYEDKGLFRRVGLLRKLITTNLKNAGSIEVYVNDVISTSHSLNAIGFAISDEWIGTLLLAGLPEEYKPMILGLESSGLPITGDVIKVKLLQEVDSKGNDDVAFFNKEHSRCHICNQPGHFKKFCPKKKTKFNSPKNIARGRRRGNAMNVVLSTATHRDDNEWYFDSGCSSHYTKQRELVRNMNLVRNFNVSAANGEQMAVIGIGNGEIYPEATRGESVEIKELQFVPSINANLLSVSQMVSRGNKVNFDKQGVKVYNPNGDIIATGDHINGLFKLRTIKSSQNCYAANMNNKYDLWHSRLGHLNNKGMSQLKNIASGVEFKDKADKDCKVCCLGKQSRLKFNKVGNRGNEVLEIVHSDLCGPLPTSLGGSRYFMTFIDDKTCKIFIYFLKSKAEHEVVRSFESFIAMAERQSGKKIKILRSDNGSEYMSNSFQDVIRKHGIVHQTTNVYTPEQNGCAERNNRTIMEKARCMLAESGMKDIFWAEAVNYAVYIINRSPSSRNEVTPEEMWTNKKPDLSHLRIFGSTVMVHVPKQRRKKLNYKAIECILTGYDYKTKGYRVYDMERDIVFISRDVKFINEGKFYNFKPTNQNIVSIELNSEEQPSQEENLPNVDNLKDTQPESEVLTDEIDSESVVTLPITPRNALPQHSISNPVQSQPLRRSERERRIPGKFDDFIFNIEKNLFAVNNSQKSRPQQSNNGNVQLVDSQAEIAPLSQSHKHVAKGQQVLTPSVTGRLPSGTYPDSNFYKDQITGSKFSQGNTLADPTDVKEALSRSDSNEWKLAMLEEFESLKGNNTWSLVDLPTGQRAIPCKWIFKTKKDVTGKIVRYKARLVCKGYSQRKGENYDQTYAPVVRKSSLRYLFSLAARNNMVIEHLDCVSAFLQGNLKNDEVYMQQPNEFKVGEKVCRLNKSIYGLKQASRVWNNDLTEALHTFGFTPIKYDECIYYDDKEKIFIVIYVDDLLLIAKDNSKLTKVKERLMKRFKMKELGPVKEFIGMKVEQTPDYISIDQEHYIDEILLRFNMQDANPVSTPMNVSEKLVHIGAENQEEIDFMKNIPYQEVIGCLLYLAHCTRPDICFAVNLLSRFSSDPSKQHWTAVKHLLRYLKGTKSFKLKYSRESLNTNLIGYTDADYAGELPGRKSTTGYIFISQGGAVAWGSRKQSCVAISTCEAEYMAMSLTVQEALWWKGLVDELDKVQTIPIYCDNKASIILAEEGNISTRVKHIDVRHHFIMEAIQNKVVKINYVNTEDQIADAFTKPLPHTKIEETRKKIGLVMIN